MSRYLCTFSGKFGDILWSLATAKQIAERIVSQQVDFAVMPYYESLGPLLCEQKYIDKAFVIPDWLRTHSNHGDQPWQPPEWIEEKYDKCWHLTYRGHPGITAPSMPLVDFIAYQQGIRLQQPVIPYMDVDDKIEKLQMPVHWIQFEASAFLEVAAEKRLITYAFNDQYKELKDEFLKKLWTLGKAEGLEFLDVNTAGWREAAWAIKKALVHVSCRSASWVLATALGQDTITYEPHPSRHRNGHLGTVFTCPYGREAAIPFGMPPEVAAGVAVSWIRSMREKALVAA